MLNRRNFLKASSLLALAPTVPLFIARTGRAAPADKDGRVLVVVQLDGGNDALNTLVPYKDTQYEKLRRKLRIPTKDVLKASDTVGLHPSLRPLDKLLQAGQLAVLPGVGYPNPNRSHFESMAIWQTARLDAKQNSGSGWVGRALDPSAAMSYTLGATAPVALRGRRSVAVSLNRVDDMLLADPAAATQAIGPAPGDDLLAFVRRQAVDANQAASRLAQLAASDGRYAADNLTSRLELVARLLKADVGARVYYTNQTGYDTHAHQQFTHAGLLSEFAEATARFFDDLAAAKLAERVTLVAFSEFGRTIKENNSGGTDHGTAGAMFVAGPGVKGGVASVMPSLTDLVDGEPKMTTDFRRVYAAVLEDWLGLSALEPLGGRFEHQPLFKTSLQRNAAQRK
jgi:uncharacterized protein (DUF1501 family)